MSNYDEDREADGAAAEREKTVAYLMALRGGFAKDKDTAKKRHRMQLLSEILGAIERGEHAP